MWFADELTPACDALQQLLLCCSSARWLSGTGSDLLACPTPRSFHRWQILLFAMSGLSRRNLLVAVSGVLLLLTVAADAPAAAQGEQPIPAEEEVAPPFVGSSSTGPTTRPADFGVVEDDDWAADPSTSSASEAASATPSAATPRSAQRLDYKPAISRLPELDLTPFLSEDSTSDEAVGYQVPPAPGNKRTQRSRGSAWPPGECVVLAAALDGVCPNALAHRMRWRSAHCL